jgi:hypothetical protein
VTPPTNVFEEREIKCDLQLKNPNLLHQYLVRTLFIERIGAQLFFGPFVHGNDADIFLVGLEYLFDSFRIERRKILGKINLITSIRQNQTQSKDKKKIGWEKSCTLDKSQKGREKVG